MFVDGQLAAVSQPPPIVRSCVRGAEAGRAGLSVPLAKGEELRSSRLQNGERNFKRSVELLWIFCFFSLLIKSCPCLAKNDVTSFRRSFRAHFLSWRGEAIADLQMFNLLKAQRPRLPQVCCSAKGSYHPGDLLEAGIPNLHACTDVIKNEICPSNSKMKVGMNRRSSCHSSAPACCFLQPVTS